MDGLSYQPGYTALRLGWCSDGVVGHLELNRPAASNAFNSALWEEFPRAVRQLQTQGSIRVAVVSGAGRNFCAGLDLAFLGGTFADKMADTHSCPARLRATFRREIELMQEAFSVLESCTFPIIAAVHGACVGAGVDLVTAADLRLCSADAAFSVKEVDVAITADLGTLQRLPAIIGHGAAAELALTARVVRGPEAARLGLVSRCFDSRQELMAGAAALAADIAAKSPLAVAGTKQVLLHTRDGCGGVAGGLRHVALWNSAYLLSEDMARVIQAQRTKQPPVFSKL